MEFDFIDGVPDYLKYNKDFAHYKRMRDERYLKATIKCLGFLLIVSVFLTMLLVVASYHQAIY